MSGLVPDFGDPDPCDWCGDDARGVTLRDDGLWRPTCGEPGCSDDGPYRGAA